MERLTYQDIPEALFSNLRSIEDFIGASDLDQKLLELIRFRVSQINQCAYCLDMHYKEAKHGGETELRLSLLPAWKESKVFNKTEEAVLAYAEAMTMLSEQAIEDSFNGLLPYFSKPQIAILSLTITQINTWNRLMKAFNFKAGEYKVS